MREVLLVPGHPGCDLGRASNDWARVCSHAHINSQSARSRSSSQRPHQPPRGPTAWTCGKRRFSNSGLLLSLLVPRLILPSLSIMAYVASATFKYLRLSLAVWGILLLSVFLCSWGCSAQPTPSAGPGPDQLEALSVRPQLANIRCES